MSIRTCSEGVPACAWRPETGGVRLCVRLTPRSDRDAADGVRIMSDGRAVLVVRVRAVAEKGAANEALERLLAALLGVARSDVRIVAGAQARLKQVRIAGDPGVLEAGLARLAGLS